MIRQIPTDSQGANQSWTSACNLASMTQQCCPLPQMQHSMAWQQTGQATQPLLHNKHQPLRLICLEQSFALLRQTEVLVMGHGSSCCMCLLLLSAGFLSPPCKALGSHAPSCCRLLHTVTCLQPVDRYIAQGTVTNASCWPCVWLHTLLCSSNQCCSATKLIKQTATTH